MRFDRDWGGLATQDPTGSFVQCDAREWQRVAFEETKEAIFAEMKSFKLNGSCLNAFRKG